MGDTETNVISKSSIKRLVKDIKELKNDPLKGIFYRHNETNMLKGSALIIGPDDTPYRGGYYLFSFNFPTDYPHSPPKLEFLTGDGLTRLHPNLYKNGKVCLSILNTWDGDSWTGCQTISTILLTIQSIFTNNPLINEPNITHIYKDFYNYTEIIRFKNIVVSILSVVNNSDNKYSNIDNLIKIARDDFINNYEDKIKILKLAIKEYESFKKKNNNINKTTEISCSIYKMSCKIDYITVKSLFNLVKEKVLLTDIF
ncbi:ubiquitin-conjugating enzyme E2 [bacterium]|nr:ubiquitin-conjugating enzyme E2 [bacterium]